ncbi:aminoglycoside phosphotransferase [Thermoclostridium stercorarium subsp. stercorarium DSM 8532]|uniref:Aminoglycoside phosphotransferase n=3 Tax=Thermoclostridium stercorarium TaxID=1510 RepID=L7VPF0_THES1|nr:aminoglycoside phosphotransferase family protein [Thermoclostridium stercorarium]AGC68554.1 aminoglycoside phosphotransferase [Thermoclostridium stercorarium subsp. stercorarium DSM 8532]AGI39570.1 aminoglycoside phosphotransferase [Thermoclostridium stercorarium subsp. stercorarium DSM 8532]ANW98904.1 aminoglycoside phosphotransferase [Thermoclostridium stercorarium subsp. thermolacticum DSM 2910]ANX01431.1 aminoglycoside phosphotransferase [Thermoclostridium stercorarium subsp. leptospartu
MNSSELRYIEIIKSSFPQLDLSRIEFNKTDGTHSDIAIVNNEVVFKFARYDWSAAYLRNEAEVVGFIRDFITMDLPKVEMVYPNVSKRSFVKGSPLYRNILLKLDHHTQDAVARQIATFLDQLHNIPVKKAQYAGIGDSQMNKNREEWLLELETMQRKIAPYCTEYVKEYLRQIIQPAVENEEFFEFQPVLIHGDLKPNHILFDKSSRRITGIIGFDNAGFGDPAYDFGMLMDHLGENFLMRVNKYYPITSEYLDRARFYAYISNFMWYRDICDMIATRDFSRFQIPAKDRDILPLGATSQNVRVKPQRK